MAQREEETEVQLTESLALCANNCGFQRSPATGNLCQSCFQSQIRNPPPSGSGSRARSDPTSAPERKASAEERAVGGSAAAADAAPPAARPTGANRCSGCGKRVGLTGFRCRCGELFCGTHRYSDRHVCGYDYKRAGREEIRRDNPVVRAAKIVRI